MPDLRHLVLVGPEPLRRHHLAAELADGPQPLTRIDAEERPGDLLSALASAGGLFGSGTLLAAGIHALDTAASRTAAGLLDGTPHRVVATADTLPAALEKTWGAHARIVKLSATRGKALASAYQQVAAILGVQLSAADAVRLEARTGTDHGRAVGVLQAVAAMGSPAVTAKHVELLAGNAEEPGMPWTLLDSLERGDIARARVELARVEAIPTLAYLAKRWTAAAVLAEGHSSEQAIELVGALSDSALAQASRLAASTDAAGRSHVLSTLATADRYAKTGRPAAGLALAVAAIRLALTAPRTHAA